MTDAVQHVRSMAELQALFLSTTYVAIDFFATWCGPCKAISPRVEKLAAANSIPNKLAFAKVDIEEARDIATAYRITAMPTFLFFKNGKQVAVHGKAMIQGGDGSSFNALSAAVDKLSALAKK